MEPTNSGETHAPRWVLPNGATTARLVAKPAPPPKQRDARRSSRQTVFGVAGTVQFRLDVTIIDVSDEGVGVETRQRLPFLARAPLRISVDNHALEWIGEMKWCRVARIERKNNDSRPVFAAGFRISSARATITGTGGVAVRESESESVRESVLAALQSRRPEAAWSPGPIG